MIPRLSPVQRSILAEMISLWKTGPLVTLLCARRLGKTYLCCAYADYMARHKPGARIKYAGATAESVRDFTVPIMDEITRAWGGALPKWKAQEDAWVYPNGSRIKMVGCDEKLKAERLRGPACDLVIVDEASFIPILSYVVENVFRYQLMSRPIWENGKIVSNTGGGVMVIASSAPESTEDPFGKYIVAGRVAGRCVERTIWDATHMPRAEIEDICRQSGGERSTTWRREALNESVTDANRAVIPEMAACKGPKGEWIAVVGEAPIVPEYRWRATALDVGHVDMWVAALGYVDFLGQRLVIEDEASGHHDTSAQIAQATLDVERLRWGLKAPPNVRVADAQPQTLADLAAAGLRCQAPKKPDMAASVVALRDRVKMRSVLIHPRCRTIIAHMSGAVWNASRKDMERVDGAPDPITGEMLPAHHFDGLPAARYLNDVADFQNDPRPSPVTLGVAAGFKRENHRQGLHLLGRGARR